MTQRQRDFINYLVSHYDYIRKIDAVPIGKEEFGLSLWEAVKAYDAIEDYQ